MPPAAVIRSLLVFDDKHPLFGTYKVAKRVAIGIVGGTVLLLGVVMMVTPGPGLAGILAGLGILAIEFTWARIWLKKVKSKSQEMAQSIMRRNNGASTPAAANAPVAGEVAKSAPPRERP
jgi:tellurite resistance protein TerC